MCHEMYFGCVLTDVLRDIKEVEVVVGKINVIIMNHMQISPCMHA